MSTPEDGWPSTPPAAPNESVSPAAESSETDLPRSRRRVLFAIVAAVVVLAVVVAVLALGGGESKDDQYLAALEKAKLRTQFAADRQAFSVAKKVCARIDGGDKAQGSKTESIAVEFYCPEYAKAFHVLKSDTVVGTFVIHDYESGNRGGGSCEGAGGYGDLNASTKVVVHDSAGNELARTSLGSGKGSIVSCTFTFTFDVTEGAASYILEVGDRGEISYTYEEITEPGHVALSIG